MRATDAVADLLRSDLKWRRFFKRCCETSAFRLRAQAWQFRAGLAERGIRADLEDVQSALLTIAGKTLPNTPAGRTGAGVSDWRDHALDCECQDCSATMPRHVQAPPHTAPVEHGTAAADAKMAATGVIQTERQAFDVARDYFGRDERGAAS
jgi:hypothetical protein